mgnify:CR=1 FL=1
MKHIYIIATKRKLLFLVCFLLLCGIKPLNAARAPQNKTALKISISQKKGSPFYKKWTKRAKLFRILKNHDDLWVLKLLLVVIFLGIITFALSAIMLAIGGMSSLWLTLMIIGGIIGVLPMLLIGALLLFRI